MASPRTAIVGALSRYPRLLDAARLVRSPRDELLIRADVAKTRRAMAAIVRGFPEPAADAPVVCLTLLTDWVFALKMHLVLGLALRLEGWRVVAVTETSRSRVAQRYCEAFGTDEIVALGDVVVEAAELGRAEAAAHDLLSRDAGFAEVKAWTFGGAWIGPQILSTLARSSMGAPDPRDPNTRAALELLVPKTIAQVLRAQALVERLRPARLISNEPNYALTGAFVDAAITGGADVIHFTQPWRDDALMCKRLTAATRRMHPSSLSPESLAWLGETPWTDREEDQLWSELRTRYGGQWFLQGRNQPSTRTYEPEALRARMGIEPGARVAAVFVHVLWDANLFYGDDLFEDYSDWFAQTARAACENPKLTWILKLHPANVWKRDREEVTSRYLELEILDRIARNLPDHVKVLPPDTDISTLSLFELADFGVTVRGTPGMEHACFGKTVITAGTGRYSGLGFTVDPHTRDEYLDLLRRLPEVPSPSSESVLRAKRHAHAVFRIRPWVMRSFVTSFTRRARGAGVLDENLFPSVDSLEAIRANGDLAAFARWVQGSDADYLSIRHDRAPGVRQAQT